MLQPPRNFDATGLNPKLRALVIALADEFSGKAIGHCVRVDHLTSEEGVSVCLGLRTYLADSVDKVSAYVLSHDRQDQEHIPADRAVELRNRKSTSLCLFVPANLQDAAASSLGNSFSPFDLPRFLKRLADALRRELPREVEHEANAALRQLRGAARVPTEDVINYLSTILAAPTLETVGLELWRIGLIPDLTDGLEGFSRRVELNRKSVDAIARPSRPYSSVAERVASLKLSPDTIQAKLIQYLMGRRLQSDREWLLGLLGEEYCGVLTFECWVFPDVEPSDLTALHVEPLYSEDAVARGSGLTMDGAGTVPYARCGDKKFVAVKWKSEPSRPTDVAQWRLEIIPDRAKYDPQDVDQAGVELPQVTVRGSVRSAKIPLEIDPNTLVTREVQIRITALDGNGSEICRLPTDEEKGLLEEERPVEGLSLSFYLEADGKDPEAGPLKDRKLPTERTLPDALLRFALKAKDKPTEIIALTVEEKDQLYFPFRIGQRALTRVMTTPFLFRLERSALSTFALGGRFRAVADGVDSLKMENVVTEPVQVKGDSVRGVWDKFTRERKAVFNSISQAGGQIVETVQLTEALGKHVRSYARAYCDLIDAALDDSAVSTETLDGLLGLDTLSVVLPYLAGSPRATVFLPTHPLRLLWYIAYAEWVQRITEELWRTPQKQRERRFNLKALEQMAAFNLPAYSLAPIVTGQKTGMGSEPQIFADNLNFFWSVNLPLSTNDPGMILSEVARVLGLNEYQVALTNLSAGDVAEEVKSYFSLHPYLKTLRVNAVNPGSGEFVHDVFMQALSGNALEEDEAIASCQLDLITHVGGEVQAPAPGLDTLSSDWYRRGLRRRGNHLQPGIQVARRPLDRNTLENLPGGDVHLSLCLDNFKPELQLSTEAWNSDQKAAETSSSVFGLLTHFQTRFSTQDGYAFWERRIAFGGDSSSERHPVNRAYSDLLVESQEAYLKLLALTLSRSNPTTPTAIGIDSPNQGWHKGVLPAVRLTVGPDERRLVGVLHVQSDWVLTIDRHFGVEFFDTPNDAYLGGQARQYLLDYTPEFVDGLGHRLVVTTQWKEEVIEVLSEAMEELGLASDEESSAEMLRILKMISGRLALRLVGDGDAVSQSTLAKETVSLAVVANYLQNKGDLSDAILVPLDAHQRLFFDAKTAFATDSGSRCDLLIVRPMRQRLQVDFVEVKYRQGSDPITPNLLGQMEDQTQRTDKAIRGMYFDPERLDSPILRCQFAAILRFYAQRAKRHGRVSNDAKYNELLDSITRVEMGMVKLASHYRGFVVNLGGKPRKPFKHGDVSVTVLTGMDVETGTSFYRRSSQINQNVPIEINDVVTESSAEGDNDQPNELTENVAALAPIIPDVANYVDSSEKNASPLLGVTTPAEITDVDPDLFISLGINSDTGEEVEWVGSVKGSPHLFVMGIPGQGKSWGVLRLLSEISRRGVPSLILDFHGQFADPNTPFARDSKPLVLSASEGLPFSPFEVVGDSSSQWKVNAFQVSEILQYVCDLGDMQRDLVYEAIHNAYVRQGFGGHSTEEMPPLPTVREVFTQLKELEAERRGIKNTVARVRPLFEFNLFRDSELMDHGRDGDNTVKPHDFTSLYGQTSVIDLHDVGMESLQLAAGAFVLRKLYKDT